MTKVVSEKKIYTLYIIGFLFMTIGFLGMFSNGEIKSKKVEKLEAEIKLLQDSNKQLNNLMENRSLIYSTIKDTLTKRNDKKNNPKGHFALPKVSENGDTINVLVNLIGMWDLSYTAHVPNQKYKASTKSKYYLLNKDGLAEVGFYNQERHINYLINVTWLMDNNKHRLIINSNTNNIKLRKAETFFLLAVDTNLLYAKVKRGYIVFERSLIYTPISLVPKINKDSILVKVPLVENFPFLVGKWSICDGLYISNYGCTNWADVTFKKDGTCLLFQKAPIKKLIRTTYTFNNYSQILIYSPGSEIEKKIAYTYGGLKYLDSNSFYVEKFRSLNSGIDTNHFIFEVMPTSGPPLYLSDSRTRTWYTMFRRIPTQKNILTIKQ